MLVFYAEQVWEVLRHREDGNALQMEQDLAALSDLVIIVVESAGSIAELGAFASEERLRHRLWPILEKRHNAEESFINTGPVAWVNRDSLFKPAVYTNLDEILGIGHLLDQRMATLTRRRGRLSRSEKLALSESNPKLALLLLCDLLSIAGPLDRTGCHYFLTATLEAEPHLSVGSLVGLAQGLDLVREHYWPGDGLYYYRTPVEPVGKSFLGLTDSQVESLRAEFASVLRTIDGAREIFDATVSLLHAA